MSENLSLSDIAAPPVHLRKTRLLRERAPRPPIHVAAKSPPPQKPRIKPALASTQPAITAESLMWISGATIVAGAASVTEAGDAGETPKTTFIFL